MTLTPPFFFPQSQITYIFCEAHAATPVPRGLMLMRPNVVLIASAHFSNAYSLAFPDQPFSYWETSFFLPVRRRFGLGLYPTHIFPSTQLPIDLGDEFYSFPKRLGVHETSDTSVTLLAEDGQLTFEKGHFSHFVREVDVIGTMGAWYGVPRSMTMPAFIIGDGFLNLIGLPLARNIGVYNPQSQARHHTSLAGTTLNHATFTVLKWHSLIQIDKPHITTSGAFFDGMALKIKKAYATTLDMALSTNRVLG